MIEKMKKVSIVLLNSEREAALKKLRKLGLVHLEKLEGNSEKLTAYKQITENAIIAQSVLAEVKVAKSKNVPSLADEKEIFFVSV